MSSKLNIIEQAKKNIRNALLTQQNLGLDIETVLLVAENIIMNIQIEYEKVLKTQSAAESETDTE